MVTNQIGFGNTKMKKTILTLLFLLRFVLGQAQDTLLLNSSIADLQLTQPIEVWIDSSACTPFSQAQSARFSQNISLFLKQHEALRSEQKNCWFRFGIKNTANTAQTLVLNTLSVDNATLFLCPTTSKIPSETLHSGYINDKNSRIFFTLTLAPKTEYQVWLCQENKIFHTPKWKFEWCSAADLKEKVGEFYIEHSNWFMFQLLFQGAVWMQLLFIFFQWYLTKRHEYLFYGLYLFPMLLFFLLEFNEVVDLNVAYDYSSSPSLYFWRDLVLVPFPIYAQFARFFLGIKKSDRVHPYFRFIEVGIPIFVVFDLLTQAIGLKPSWQFLLYHSFSLLIFSIGGILLYLLLQYKNNLARFVAIGMFCFSCGAFVSDFMTYLIQGAHCNFLFPDIFIQVGFLLELLCFSMGLAYKNKLVNRERNQLEKDVAKVEMIALQAQINPHFIFNVLNSISLYIQKNDNNNATKYLNKFSKLMRLVLDNSTTELISLETELKTLHLYLEIEQMRFRQKFSYLIEVENNIDVFNTQIPPMLLQPYLENAIWHGLIPLEQREARLHIYLRQTEEQLQITIHDNGIGRVASQQHKQLQTNTYTKSHGMSVTANRIRLLGEKMDAEAKVSIEDLYDEQQEAQGTKVVVVLPLIYAMEK
jgi:hypothetical protein